MNTHWLAYCSIIPNHPTYHLTQWKTVSQAWNIYLLFASQINISDDFPPNDDEIWTEPVKHFSKWLSNFSTEARNAAVTKIGYRFFFIFYLFSAHSRNLHRKFTRFRSLCPKIVRSLYQKCGGTKSACYAGHSIYVLGNIVWWIREWALIAFLCRYSRKAVGFLCNP